MESIINVLVSGLQQGLIWCLLVLGVYISFRILDCADLSVEGTFPLGATIAALLIFFKVPPIIATIIAMCGGIIGGIVTGLIHTKLKIPAILSGIITMTALTSVNLVILGLSSKDYSSKASLAIDNSIYLGPRKFIYDFFHNVCNIDTFTQATASKISTIVITLTFVLVVYLLIYYLFGTEFGMSLRATGNNPKMAKAQGINTTLMVIVGLAISNGLVALSGALFAQNSANANVDSGRGSIVIGLASIIIGEMLFGRKSFKVALVSVIFGSVIFFILKAIAIRLGVAHYLNLVVAILITIILALPVIKPVIASKKKVKQC